MKQIAVWIADRLIKSSALPKTATASTGQVVYLARPADELRDAWKRVANDLIGAGHVVLPSGPLPDTMAAAEATIRDALAKAVLSVHFVGESGGAKPEGSDEGIVRLQLRLARELSGPSAQRLLWVPKWLPGRQDNKRDPFDVLKRFGGLIDGEEVYAEEVTDLSQTLRARLTPSKPGAAHGISRILVAAAAPEDDGLAAALANRMQSKEMKVTPVFAADTQLLHDNQQGAALVVLWDKAGKAAIDALLDSVAPGIEHVTVLWLPGSDETAKQRFFRQGIYVEQLPGIPADRKAARQLLAQLEIPANSHGAAS